MVDLNKYIIDDRIFSVKFSCDLIKCKGACCTLEGTDGAPILESELPDIKRSVSKAKKYLSQRNIDVIDKYGYFVKDGEKYSLNNVDDNDCVFSFYDKDNIVRCSFQTAYWKGENDWVKPSSCYLFPIRVSGKKRNILRYEEFYECSDALEKGEVEDVSVFEFLKEPLIREFGKDFYNNAKNKFLNKDS
ncbi:DUF3109 family protein [soil metagenome]